MAAFGFFGGGVEACRRAGFGYVDLVEKFRSLEVEKDLIIILSTETSLRLIFAPISRPIIAPTSQVGEVAVVRTSVSYKCGWGSNNKKLTPFLTLPAGEGTRADAQLTYSPRPFGRADLRTDLSPDSERIEPAGALLRRRNSESVEQIQDRAEFVSELCELRNSGEGLKNYSLKQHPPTTSGHFPRKGGRGSRAQLILNRIAVIQSPTTIQGRRISKTFYDPVTYTSKVLSSRTCFGNLPANKEFDPSPEFLSFALAQLEILPSPTNGEGKVLMPLDHLITRLLDHFPQKEVLL